MKGRIVFKGNSDGCFLPFESHPEQSDAQTTNSCDPEHNKNLQFWKDYLECNPEEGKQILEKYFPSVCFLAEEPLLQWDFLFSFNLTIRGTILRCVISAWSWEQTRTYLQKQIDSGIVFTADEWDDIFMCHPQAKELAVPWNDFTPDEWAMLLRRHPQIAERCPFGKFMPKQWIPVLAKHPELESWGVCFDKFTAEDWKDLCGWNPDFILHKENWTSQDDLQYVFLLRQHFIKHKKLLLGFQAASNLCNGNEETYQMTVFDMDTGLPKKEHIGREEVARILEPFRHEQEVVYKFLSSGNTAGILQKFQDNLVKELPLHNRIDLENLLAIGRPGPSQYWEEYKENRPCRLAMASKIAEKTRGILLFEEQQKQALQLLTGCSSEEAIMLYEKNCGIKLHRPYRELFLQLIAEHNGVTREEAEKLYEAWHFYIQWGGVRHYKIKKAAHRVYLRALEFLREMGEIPLDHVK